MSSREHIIVSKFGSNQVARFYRPNFSRDDAVSELEGQPARAFLVRIAAADAVVISYVKPGNVIIHHRVFITPTGNLVPDGAAAGENFRTLHALLAAKGFVTPLDEQTPPSSATASASTSSAMPTIGYGNTPSVGGATTAAAAAAAPPGSAVDALHAQPELARFFCAHSRERVCQLLGDAPDDTFMMRASSAGDGSIALSFKDRGNVRHCRILRDARGFYVDGDEDRAPTLVQVLRTFNFKIPDAPTPTPAAPAVAEQTPTPGYTTPQQMFNMQLQPVAGYGGIPVGPDPSHACTCSCRSSHRVSLLIACSDGRTPGPAPTPGYVGVPDSLRVNTTPGYVGVPDSLRVNNGDRSSSGCMERTKIAVLCTPLTLVFFPRWQRARSVGVRWLRRSADRHCGVVQCDGHKNEWPQ